MDIQRPLLQLASGNGFILALEYAHRPASAIFSERPSGAAIDNVVGVHLSFWIIMKFAHELTLRNVVVHQHTNPSLIRADHTIQLIRIPPHQVNRVVVGNVLTFRQIIA